MTTTTKSYCRSCGAEILWITTPNEKKMPVNAALTRIITIDHDERQVGSAAGHVSHFATCPKADAWRKE